MNLPLVARRHFDSQEKPFVVYIGKKSAIYIYRGGNGGLNIMREIEFREDWEATARAIDESPVPRSNTGAEQPKDLEILEAVRILNQGDEVARLKVKWNHDPRGGHIALDAYYVEQERKKKEDEEQEEMEEATNILMAVSRS